MLIVPFYREDSFILLANCTIFYKILIFLPFFICKTAKTTKNYAFQPLPFLDTYITCTFISFYVTRCLSQYFVDRFKKFYATFRNVKCMWIANIEFLPRSMATHSAVSAPNIWVVYDRKPSVAASPALSAGRIIGVGLHTHPFQMLSADLSSWSDRSEQEAAARPVSSPTNQRRTGHSRL